MAANTSQVESTFQVWSTRRHTARNTAESLALALSGDPDRESA
jgi:hypothetical protein